MLKEKSEKANVFNIVHGSFVDGWGIRTTVFLKGCPLRCIWCCNPESQLMVPELQYIEEHCDGCGRCVDKCPKGAIIQVCPGEKVSIDREKCDGCGDCVDVCWPGAFNIWGLERSAEDVFAECLRDEKFYKESGGGVTLSGGEATLWPLFCLEMIERCHERDIHVALDTCGYITTDEGMEVFKNADTLLFDIKGLASDVHKKNTGKSNEIILKNLYLAEELGKDVIVRYPVIPNHNMDEAPDIAKLLSGLKCVHRVDIIPFHKFGGGKYSQLGRVY
ncbi:MAG: glycyl-radical enzyme activating protein, partial [Eubacterium sp.]|nr:glycyl-radical enzyme activating protein [Eubacterium sp.]